MNKKLMALSLVVGLCFSQVPMQAGLLDKWVTPERMQYIKQSGNTVVETIKENPVACALVGGAALVGAYLVYKSMYPAAKKEAIAFQNALQVLNQQGDLSIPQNNGLVSEITAHRYVQNAIQAVESFLDEVNTSNLETQMIIQKDIEAGTFSFDLSYDPTNEGFITLNINTKTSSSNFFKSSSRSVQSTGLIENNDQAVTEIMQLVLLEMGFASKKMRDYITERLIQDRLAPMQGRIQ